MKPLARNRYVCFFVLVTAGLTWDLVSKSWAFSSLGYPGGKSAWWVSYNGKNYFRLHTNFNPGALFGIGQGHGYLFALGSIVAISWLIYWLFFRGGASSKWLTVAGGLITAGALGNLYDRLYLHGCVNPATGEPILGVRDFLSVIIPVIDYGWPIFNFADAFLMVGAFMLFLQSFRHQEEHSEPLVTQTTQSEADGESQPAASAAVKSLPAHSG